MMLLKKHNIGPKYLGMLAFIYANGKYKTHPYIGEILKTTFFNSKVNEYFEQIGWVEYVKNGRKDPWWRVRLSAKGKEILEAIYGPNRTSHPKAQEFAEILNKSYNDYGISFKFKDMNKTVQNISYWLNFKEIEQGKEYDEKMFKAVVDTYIESFDYESKKYIKESTTLFFTPDTRYSEKWTPEQCPIEGFVNIKENRTKINLKFKTL